MSNDTELNNTQLNNIDTINFELKNEIKLLSLIDNELEYPVNIQFHYLKDNENFDEFNNTQNENSSNNFIPEFNRYIYNINNGKIYQPKLWDYYEPKLDDNHRIFIENKKLVIFNVIDNHRTILENENEVINFFIPEKNNKFLFLNNKKSVNNSYLYDEIKNYYVIVHFSNRERKIYEIKKNIKIINFEEKPILLNKKNYKFCEFNYAIFSDKNIIIERINYKHKNAQIILHNINNHHCTIIDIYPESDTIFYKCHHIQMENNNIYFVGKYYESDYRFEKYKLLGFYITEYNYLDSTYQHVNFNVDNFNIHGIIENKLIYQFKKEKEIRINKLQNYCNITNDSDPHHEKLETHRNNIEEKLIDKVTYFSYCEETKKLTGITTENIIIVWDVSTFKIFEVFYNDFIDYYEDYSSNNTIADGIPFYLRNNILIMQDDFSESRIIFMQNKEIIEKELKPHYKHLKLKHISRKIIEEYINVKFLLSEHNIIFPSLEEINAMRNIIYYFMKLYIDNSIISEIIARYI